MTAAVALAVVLVIAVAGLSLAMQTQRPAGQGPTGPRPRPRPQAPTVRRPRERKPQPAASSPPPPPPAPKSAEGGSKGPELLRTGTAAKAKVVSVVDERTVGPVTRSRLVLSITPDGGDAFEVTTRTAFPTPADRSSVKVGGTVDVRYDPNDHGRVVLELAKSGGSGGGSGSETAGREEGGTAADPGPTAPGAEHPSEEPDDDEGGAPA